MQLLGLSIPWESMLHERPETSGVSQPRKRRERITQEDIRALLEEDVSSGSEYEASSDSESESEVNNAKCN